ncbi:MAG TPA: DNA polymerase III subunit delta [Kaistia sp.]|nr:DNA polymerase III subunit delta [Kaistia sp.]
MVQIKPQDAERFLRKPDPAIRVVLIYGNDVGLVSERVAGFAATIIGGSNDPFALIRLDSSEIAADPGRLADEAGTIGLFGGDRAIRVRVAGNRPIQAAVEAVLANPPRDAWIILEAGDIKKGTGLRKLCEAARGAAAIACYADGAAMLDGLIDSEMATAGLAIDDDARELLRGLLGADRLASRSEVQKLTLYATGLGRVDVEAVKAIVGDASATAVDEAVDAMAGGDVAILDRSFRRLIASGTPAFVVAAAGLRQLQLLHRILAAVEEGAPAESAIESAAGYIFPQRKAKLGQQVRLWTADRLFMVAERVERAIFESRIKPALGDAIVEKALTGVALSARARRR